MPEPWETKLHALQILTPPERPWEHPRGARLGSPSGPRQPSRLLAGVVAVAVAVAAILVARAAFGGGGNTSTGVRTPAASPTQTGSPQGTSESVALRGSHGLRCTVTLPPVVQPGRDLALTFSIENVSGAPVDQPSGYSSVQIQDGDGMTWDTADLSAAMGVSGGGYSPPQQMAPGASETSTADVAVQFAGPLSVTPVCAGQTMPALSTDVADPGTTPLPGAAVARAVAATSGLFARCAPTPSEATIGTVMSPDHAHSMDVRCSAAVKTAPGFAVVTLMMNTPADGPVPDVSNGFVVPAQITAKGNAEAIVWRFVVTANNVYPVGASTHTSTRGYDAMEPEYNVGAGGWHGGGASRCGGDGTIAGGNGKQVGIAFIDVCH
ncbi:MAG TPA: hypothetical protein VGQ50_06570 [Actinomycetota bacterium]|nr:hypothetical protein [Actinomycetota bacterium]